MSNFKRVFDNPSGIVELINSNSFLRRICGEQVYKGKGFFAFRNGIASMYIKGVPLVYFDDSNLNDFRVVSRLLPVARSFVKAEKKTLPPVITEKSWQDRLNVDIGFSNVLCEILENIGLDSRPECAQVSSLYKYSPFSNVNERWFLIDIEAAFNEPKNEIIEAEIDDNLEENKKDNRVDVVFYDDNTSDLFFIEVKRSSDERLFNGEINTQMEGYKQLIKREGDAIKKAYSSVLSYYKSMGCAGIKNTDINNIYLALAITEYSQEEKTKYVTSTVKRLRSDFPVVSIGSFSNVKPETLKKWDKIIRNNSI